MINVERVQVRMVEHVIRIGPSKGVYGLLLLLFYAYVILLLQLEKDEIRRSCNAGFLGVDSFF